MHKEIYTFTELENQLRAFILEVNTYSQYYSNAFLLLYLTGCRPLEIFDAQRWSIFEDEYVLLQPAKGNNIRVLPFNLFPPGYVTSIYSSKIQSSYLSRSTLERYFYKYFYARPTFIYDSENFNPIGLYLFRHFRMKEKYNELGNVEAVSDFFGEVDHKNTASYIFSQLYYTAPD